jgi:hypothetical protein
MSIQVTLKGRVERGRQRNKTFLVSNTDNSTMTAKTDEAEGIQSTQCKEKNPWPHSSVNWEDKQYQHLQITVHIGTQTLMSIRNAFGRPKCRQHNN